MSWSDRLANVLSVCVAAMAFSTSVVGTTNADEPSIAQLIEGVPNLTTTDPKLTAFSVRLTTAVPFETPFETRAVWRKDGEVGLLTTTGEGQAPVWFLSASQAAFFDVCSGSVLIKKDGRLKLNLQLSGESLKMDYGIGSGDDHRVDVRLRSLFDPVNFGEGAVSRTEDGNLVFESKVSARGYRTIATFDGSEPHSLRSVDFKRAEGDVPVFRLDDIRLNDEAGVRWPRLPASDAFPPGIRVVDIDNDALDAQTQVVWLTRSQIGYAGLREAKWRDVPGVAGVDWNKALEHAQSLEPLGAKLATEADRDSVDDR